MTVATRQDAAGKSLTFTWGARQTHVLPIGVASLYSGLVRDVVPRLVEEYIKDPGLRDMLSNPRLAYEFFSAAPTESEDGLEAPVRPDDDWQEVVRKAREAAYCELGMALRAEGG